MKKYMIFICLIWFVGFGGNILLPSPLFAAESVQIDREQLQSTLQEELTQQITDAIESGQQQLRDAAMNRVYQEVQKVIEENIDVAKIQERVNQVLNDHPTLNRLVEDYETGKSQEVIDSVTGFYDDARAKVDQIIAATKAYQEESIPETEYKDLLEKYGVKGRWVDKVGEWEQFYQQSGASYVEDMKTLYAGFEGGEPGGQLTALFTLMEKYSDKVPGLGQFIKLYAQVGKEMLAAAIRAGQLIRQREQGCLGDGTHSAIDDWYNVGDPVNVNFSQTFEGRTACPSALDNIFFDYNDPSRLYFWTGKAFLQGNSGNGGIDAVIAIMAFLNEVGMADKTKDMATLQKFYNSAFLKLRELTDILLERISAHLMRLDNIRLVCGETAYQNILRNRGAFTNTRQNFEDNKPKIFNRIIISEVLEDGRAMETYTRAESKLSQLYAVVVRGRVTEEKEGTSSPAEGASIEIQKSGCEIWSGCQILTTESDGRYKFVVLLTAEEAPLKVKAVKGDVKSEEKEMMLDRNDFYRDGIDLVLDAEEEEVRQMESLMVTPSEVELYVGESRAFKAQAIYDDEFSKDVTGQANWSSGSNQFTGTAPGDFGRSASFGGYTAAADISVTCPDDRPDWNAELGECASLGSAIDSVKNGEEEEELCDEEAMLADYIILMELVSEANLVYAGFEAKFQKFRKEINDQDSDVCKNTILAVAFAGAKRDMAEMERLAALVEDVATALILQLGICPDLTLGLTVRDIITEVAKLGRPRNEMIDALATMQSLLATYGCDEQEVSENGEQVAENTNDPNIIDDGGAGGSEVCGDGKDNDGDGLIDEGCSSTGNYNVALYLYDSGSAKDDIFGLSVSGHGNLGTTPEGGARTYPLNLAPGSYVATVSVISAPDNVGTFTLTIREGDTVIAGESGGPGQGTQISVPFTVGAVATSGESVLQMFDPGIYDIKFPNEEEIARQRGNRY
ncbi:hypothetical protein GF407_20505 [candidate division KSB1 bacterium]|nr:hypothetical protein [candidate division KSB1 bacterium]